MESTNKDGAPMSVKEHVSHLITWCLPVLEWRKSVTFSTVRSDLIAGLVVGVMLVPTSLSWPALAQIPLSCGLASGLVASLAYGTFGQCSSLSLGPVAEVSTLLLSIPGIPVADKERVYQLIGVEVGILSLFLSAIGGGNVIKTVFAKAVADGYTTAASLLVIVMQLKVIFNVKASSAPVLQDAIAATIKALVEQVNTSSLISCGLFSLYCGYLMFIKHLHLPSWVPHQLVVVVTSILITKYFRLDETIGLSIVKDLPTSLDPPSLPSLDGTIELAPYTFTITIVAFLQSYVIGRKLQPHIDPDKELFASGMCNFCCCVAGGMPVSSSLARSAVLMDQNAKSPMTAYVAAIVMVITVFGLTRLETFYYLPYHALTAIIVSGVWKLMDFEEAKRLFHISRMDFMVWIVTFLLTLSVGITAGVLSGMGLSLILVVLRVARPRTETLGFSSNQQGYGSVKEDPELLVYPNILVWRFDAPLYFVNLGYFEERLRQALQDEVRTIRVIIVNCSKMNDIDAAVLANLPLLLKSIEGNDPDAPRRVILAELQGRVEAVLLKSELHRRDYVRGVTDVLDSRQTFFRTVRSALQFAFDYCDALHDKHLLEVVDHVPRPQVTFVAEAVVNSEGEHPDAPMSTPLLPVTGASQFGAARRVRERLSKTSLFDGKKELIGVTGVVRHAERTPKQKLKLRIVDQTVLGQLRSICFASGGKKLNADSVERIVGILEGSSLRQHHVEVAEACNVLRASPAGLKVQIKQEPSACLVVVKWGGSITQLGSEQAHRLGRLLMARFFAAGDLPLSRLDTFTSNAVAFAADEERTIQTAGTVMRALVGSSEMTDSDVVLDDALLSTVPPAAKLLMRHEAREFSAVLHVRNPGAADHLLHIDGLKRFLSLLSHTSAGLGNSPLHGGDGPVTATPPPPTSSEEIEEMLPRTFTIDRMSHEDKRLLPDVLTAEQPTAASPLEEGEHVVSDTMSSMRVAPYDVVAALGQVMDAIWQQPFSDQERTTPLYSGDTIGQLQRRWRGLADAFHRRTNKAGYGGAADDEKDEKEALLLSTEDEFDVTNVFKMADHASFDLLHNVPLLSKSEGQQQLAQNVRKAHVTIMAMETIANSILTGSSRSSRQILGSLLCSALVERLHSDIERLVAQDEAHGIEALLEEAQSVYVVAHGRFEEDVKRMWLRSGASVLQDSGMKQQLAEMVEAQKRTYPFVALSSSFVSNAEQREEHYIDLYFGPHSHVVGLQNCFFESHEVRGFHRESGATDSHRYTTHFLFKVFRRMEQGSMSRRAFNEKLLKLPLLPSSQFSTLDAHRAALRSGLLELYRSRHSIMVEPFLSSGADDTTLHVLPMTRMHSGLSLGDIASIAQEVRGISLAQTAFLGKEDFSSLARRQASSSEADCCGKERKK